jgi:sugar/nucleoside kinase (ribokinase family)
LAPLSPPDYLAIGHLTCDLLADGASSPGGTVRYAALTAARLGLRAAVLSAGAPDLALSLPATIALTLTPSADATTFANRYGPDGRRQWLHARAAPVSFAAAPPAWREAPIIHLAPLVAELDLAQALDWAAPGVLVGLTPQGYMRAWDLPLPAPVRPVAWRPAPALLRRLSLIVLSVEDVGGDEALIASYAAHCPLVVVTRGAAGATLYRAGQPAPVAPFAAREIDPTGAGDVFAAAMLVRLHATGDPQQAAAFASAAAARSVEGPGLGRFNGSPY